VFRKVGAELGFTMKPQDEEDYLEIVGALEKAIYEVEDLPEYADPNLEPVGGIEARSYTVPRKEENPLNAWSHRVCPSVQCGSS